MLVLLGNTFSQIFFPYIAANLVNAVWNLCARVLNYNSPNSHRIFNVILFIERPEWVMQICTHMHHKYSHACILLCILDSALAQGTFIHKIRERMASQISDKSNSHLSDDSKWTCQETAIGI